MNYKTVWMSFVFLFVFFPPFIYFMQVYFCNIYAVLQRHTHVLRGGTWTGHFYCFISFLITITYAVIATITGLLFF